MIQPGYFVSQTLSPLETQVMAAMALKYHVENPESEIYRNLKTQTCELELGSICTGTASFLGQCLQRCSLGGFL